MSSLFNKIATMLGTGDRSGGVDESKALSFTQDRWNDL